MTSLKLKNSNYLLPKLLLNDSEMEGSLFLISMGLLDDALTLLQLVLDDCVGAETGGGAAEDGLASMIQPTCISTGGLVLCRVFRFRGSS